MIPDSTLLIQVSRAVDPHSFFADPDPAVLFNADPEKITQKLKTIELVQIYFISKDKLLLIS